MPRTTTTRGRTQAAKRQRNGLDAATCRRLKLSPQVAWYLREGNRVGPKVRGAATCRKIPWPKCPPAIKTPEPEHFPGAKFDPSRVDRVLRAFESLEHTKGKWAGRPLRPDPWQVAYILAPVFGWVRFDKDAGRYVRIIRELYVDIPRKNGKSTLIGGIGLYMTAADGEHGAECYAAATTRDQANFVFAPVKNLVEHSPVLKKHMKAYAQTVVHPASGSYFKAISSAADAQHGANIHCSVCDELHVHKSSDLIDALETGTGSRDQPLSVCITTADDGAPDTIYSRKRDRIEKVARGTLKIPTIYGVVWCAEEGDDPFAVATQKKANPGYGISPTASYLANEAAKARQTPADLARYQRLHLGIRTKQTTKYVPMGVWDASAGMVVESHLAGQECFGGLDLSSVEDITALCWEFPDGENGADVLWRFWLPEARFKHLCERTANNALTWKAQGWLKLTPGNVIDLDFILAQIRVDMETFDVRTLGFDRWGANPLVTKLGDLGLECVPRGQGFASTSAPLKDILRMLLQERYRHSGNPVMRWMTDNLTVAMDPAGNVKPDKAKAADKIDGWSAAVNAHGEYMDNAAAQEAETEGTGPAVAVQKGASQTGDLQSAGF